MDKLHIWHLLLLLITWISFSSTRPAAPDQPPNITPPEIDSDMISLLMSDFDYPQQRRIEHHYPHGGNFQPPDKTNIRNDVWASSAYRKRGFSMLTRWKPFNSLSKQRTSIRNINRSLYAPAPAAAASANDFEMVSAETRAFSRPSGQPLRWG